MKLVKENINILKPKDDKEIREELDKNPGATFQIGLSKYVKEFLEYEGIDFDQPMFGYMFGSIIQNISEKHQINNAILELEDIEVQPKYAEFGTTGINLLIQVYGDIYDPVPKEFIDKDVQLSTNYIKIIDNIKDYM